MYVRGNIHVGYWNNEAPAAGDIPNTVEYLRREYARPITLTALDVWWGFGDSNRWKGWYVHFNGVHTSGPHIHESATGSAWGRDAEEILKRSGILEDCTLKRDASIHKLVRQLQDVIYSGYIDPAEKSKAAQGQAAQ